MYIKKLCGYILPCNNFPSVSKGLLDYYNPPKVKSSNYLHWVAQLDQKTCLLCRSKHGKVYSSDEIIFEEPPIHSKCRCIIEIMDAVFAGLGTKDGVNGADWWIKNYGILPDYYISKTDIGDLGWKPGKSPEKYAPGMMITGEIYRNDDGHLPQSIGRTWYEADINYYSGKRNVLRLLWSNDGLIFVTYNHYQTFIEII